jgi:hypothetical protein
VAGQTQRMLSRAMKGEYLLVYIDVHQQRHCLKNHPGRHLCKCIAKAIVFHWASPTNSSAHYFQQPHSPLIRSQTYLLCLFCCDPFKNTTKVNEVNELVYLGLQFRSCKGLIALLLWIETDIFNPDQNYLKYLV